MFRSNFRNTYSIAFVFIIIFFANKIFAFETEIDLRGKIFAHESTDSSANNILNNRVIFNKSANYEDSQLSRGNNWYWIKFTLQNSSLQKATYYVVIPNGLIEYVSFYVKDLDLNRVTKSIHTGIAYPFAQRLVENRQFILPIEIQSGKTLDIFVRGHINTGTLIMPIQLFDENGYDIHLLIQNILTSFVLVIWFFSMALGIILFSLFRERLYFFYTSYIVCLMLFWASYEGLSYQYLWPNSTFLANNSRNCYLMAGISFAIFIISILTHSGKKLIFIKKYIKFLSFAFLILTFFISISAKNFSNLCTQLVLLSDINLAILILVIIYAIIYKIIERNEYGLYSLLSALPIIFYVIIQLLSYYKFIYMSRTSIFMQYGFGLCSVLEVMCLVGLLIYRFHRIVTHNVLSQQSLLDSNSLIEDYKQGLLIEKKKKIKLPNEIELDYLNNLMQKLDSIIESNEVYKQQNLTIKNVSEMLEVSSHILSRCVNQVNNTNFNDYVNKKRIDECIKMLQNKKYNYLSIEAIGAEVGFSTKSTFYTTFKKFTNKLPKQYLVDRKEQNI